MVAIYQARKVNSGVKATYSYCSLDRKHFPNIFFWNSPRVNSSWSAKNYVFAFFIPIRLRSDYSSRSKSYPSKLDADIVFHQNLGYRHCIS